MVNHRDPFDEFAVLIRAETASALGDAGKKLRAALDALAAAERKGANSVVRQALLTAAADALYGYVVQKELNGITDNEMLKKAYDIPPEVWQHMGRAHAK